MNRQSVWFNLLMWRDLTFVWQFIFIIILTNTTIAGIN